MRLNAISENPQALLMEGLRRWNGELPMVVSGNSGQNIIDSKSILPAKERQATKAAFNNSIPVNTR